MCEKEYRMEPGETRTLTLHARDYYSRERIEVAPGQTYHFAVPPGERWVDWVIPSGPEGYRNRIIEWRGLTMRLAEAPCFALCGVLEKNDVTAFYIGQGLRKTFDAGGRLSFFANDACGWYWNNFGKLSLVVTRVV